MEPNKIIQCRSLVASAQADSDLLPFLRGADLDVAQGTVTVIEGLSPAEQAALSDILSGISVPIYGSVHMTCAPGELRIVTDLCDPPYIQRPGETIIVLTRIYEQPLQPARHLQANAGLIYARQA